MSYTDIFKINENGDVTNFQSVRNSYLSAPHIWNKLSEKYGKNDSMFGTHYQNTIKAFATGEYLNFEDVVLGSTLDGVYVKRENFPALIEAFNQWIVKDDQNNLKEQVEAMKDVYADKTAIGLAWRQTDISETLWDFDYDEETGETIPYNINKGDKHWELFGDLEQ